MCHGVSTECWLARFSEVSNKAAVPWSIVHVMKQMIEAIYLCIVKSFLVSIPSICRNIYSCMTLQGHVFWWLVITSSKPSIEQPCAAIMHLVTITTFIVVLHLSSNGSQVWAMSWLGQWRIHVESRLWGSGLNECEATSHQLGLGLDLDELNSSAFLLSPREK